MELRAFFEARDGKLSQDGRTFLAVARKCEVKPGYLYLVVLGHKKVTPDLANGLHAATNGECNRRDLCPDFQWDEPQPQSRRKAA
jgi:DNA-binding transcriptional regulator YdaS (Cro superfamily)